MDPQQNKHQIIVGSDAKPPSQFWRWQIHPDPKHHKIYLTSAIVMMLVIFGIAGYMLASHISVMAHIDKVNLTTKKQQQAAADEKAAASAQASGGATQNTTKPTTPGGQTTGGGTTAGGSTGGSSGGSSGGGCSGAAHHVAGGPDGTGTCWPGPNNTGVPAGTHLTAYTGPCVITTNNTVIDSKIIDCDDGLGVLASNVVIKNSKVNTYIALDSDRPGGINFSLTVQDSEVNGNGTLQSAVGAANLTLIRDNIYGGINGSECDPPMNFCTIRDTYIHGQTFKNGIDTHLGGFLSDGGTNLTIVHNTIVCDTPVNNVGGGCTGDFNMIPNFASINGALIEHNLFGANVDLSYCTYGGEKPSSPTPHSYNIVYKDNIFQKGTNSICGAYGPVTGFAVGNTGNKWTNNKYDDGTTVAPEN